MKVGDESIPLTPDEGTMTPYKRVYERIYEQSNNLTLLPEWVLPDAVSSMLLYEFEGDKYFINVNRFPEDPDRGLTTRASGQTILTGGFESTGIELAPFERASDSTLGNVNPPGAFAQIDFSTSGTQRDGFDIPAVFDGETVVYQHSSSGSTQRSIETIGVKLTLEEDAVGKHEACMSIVQALPQVTYQRPADLPDNYPPENGYEYKWIVQDSSSPTPRIENVDLRYGVLLDRNITDPDVMPLSDILGRQYFVSSLCFGVCPDQGA